MKKIASVLALIFVVGHIFASKNVKGRVLNQKDSSAVYMARVEGLTQFVFTNKNGEFSLNLSKKDTVLRIYKNGFVEKFLKPGSAGEFVITIDEFIAIVQDESEYLIMEDAENSMAVVTLNSSPQNYVKHKRMESVSAVNVGMPNPVKHVSPVFHNNESYSKFETSGFRATALHPLSTFSIDVDAASYALARRFINSGSLPPANSVRVEEMINYFSYNYDKPSDKQPVSVSLAATDCPWNKQNKIIRVGIQSSDIDSEKLPASNFVFLIDVSGSMASADKLPLAKAAFKTLLNSLRQNDRVAIVSYASTTRVVLESTPMSEKNKILMAMEGLKAGGSTSGAEGLEMAYKEAEKGFMPEGNNRILLVTDGDFNVGPSSVEELKVLVKSKRDKGIAISILGFGSGNIKDDRMEAIAQNGNGNYAYVDNLQEARKVFVKEFASNLFVVAKDVKIQVEFNPKKVSGYRLIGYDNRALEAEDFNNDRKDAGDMGASQQVTALYEITLVGSENMPVVDPLRYQKATESTSDFSNELATIKVRYKEPEDSQSQLLVKHLTNSDVKRSSMSEDLNFAVSVAMFGQLLRGSDYVHDGDFSTVANMAIQSKGEDMDGYRAEFVRLVELVAAL